MTRKARRKYLNFEREMLNLRFRKATNGVPKPSELKRIRRRIARIETVLKESALTDRSFSA